MVSNVYQIDQCHGPQEEGDAVGLKQVHDHTHGDENEGGLPCPAFKGQHTEGGDETCCRYEEVYDTQGVVTYIGHHGVVSREWSGRIPRAQVPLGHGESYKCVKYQIYTEEYHTRRSVPGHGKYLWGRWLINLRAPGIQKV